MGRALGSFAGEAKTFIHTGPAGIFRVTSGKSF